MPLLVGAAVPAGVLLGRHGLSRPGVGGLLPAAAGPLSPLAPAVLTVRASWQALLSLPLRPSPGALSLLAPAVVGAMGTRHRALLPRLLLPRPGGLAGSTSSSSGRLLARPIPMQTDLVLRPIRQPWSSACALPQGPSRISLRASPDGASIRGALLCPLMFTVTLLSMS